MAPKGAITSLLAHVIISLALVIFAIGFFPYKPFLAGEATFDGVEDVSPSTRAPFNKVIFMVVDALRSLIRQGAALPFTAHAGSPTITMPRIKAITTGSIPSFLDVILNFAESDTTSSLNGQDTWLSQLQRKEGGKLVMYGDDTWLKLFPGSFARKDGTTSFFVSDFTEVDNNVTRNIPYELSQGDWNGMVLHYLGLDHIGHKAGSRSPNMKPKQLEMDNVVREIFQAIENEPHLDSTLLVVCGDHGMNNGGNHGGGAEGETSPALVFASPKIKFISNGTTSPTEPVSGDFGYYTTVEQSDVVPTLSGLLGFPIPLNNLGVFIPALLAFWPAEQQLNLMFQNAKQIARLASKSTASPFVESMEATGCNDDTERVESLSCLWSRVMKQPSPGADQQIARFNLLQLFCERAQRVLSSAASNYDVSKLLVGILLASIATMLAFNSCLLENPRSRPIDMWFTVTSLAFAATMFSSSYVEEEHHFWYWFGSAWLSWLVVRQQRKGDPCQWIPITFMVAACVAFRLLRRWNQTGQKHAGSLDIARGFLPRHIAVLWLLVLITYARIILRLSKHSFPGCRRVYAVVPAVTIGLLSLVFKTAFTVADAPELLQGLENWILPWCQYSTLVTQARVVYLLTACLAVIHLALSHQASHGTRGRYQGAFDAVHDLLTLLLITQSRTTNIPVFLLFEVLLVWFEMTMESSLEISYTTLVFQYAGFFILGGSNAISSIDLSNAYNGVGGYNVVAVGFLTFFSNWAGPIWWASAAGVLTVAPRLHGDANHLPRSFSRLTLFSHVSVLAVMLACTAMRTHLFIWTVFSPKYLYILAWYFGQQLLVNVVCSGIFGKFKMWSYGA